MSAQYLRIGFLASGSGSSARAIVAACEAGELAGEARLMVSNNRSAPALEFALMQEVYAVSDIPGEMEEDLKLAFVERLMQEGVLIRKT